MVDEKKVEETKVEDSRRTFVGPDQKNYFVIAPSANDIREADWQYSKIFTRSLTEGITTSAEMLDILRRRGLIGPEFEQRARELTRILNEKIFDLHQSTNMDDKRKFAVEVAAARDELFQWNQRLNGPMANTCENLADDARLEYLTSCIIVNEKGDRVWDSYDSYLKEKSNALALRSRFEVMLYLQGLEQDFLEKTPEAQALKEVETDLIERAEEASKALQATVDEQVRLDELAVKAAAKIAREADKVTSVTTEKPKKRKTKAS